MYIHTYVWCNTFHASKSSVLLTSAQHSRATDGTPSSEVCKDQLSYFSLVFLKIFNLFLKVASLLEVLNTGLLALSYDLEINNNS